MMRRIASILLYLFTASVLNADTYKLHSVEQTVVGGETNILSDAILEAGEGRVYSTTNAPYINGFVFTHWSISTEQIDSYKNRDYWRRALDSAVYTLYETTTNTANYVDAALDDDCDGLADGWQLYWYGDMEVKGDSDTDEDGVSFKDEIASGTNPHFFDRRAGLPMSIAIGETITCKPNNYPWCTMRSEPEGEYVETSRRIVHPGAEIQLLMKTAEGTNLWWQCNGEWIGEPLISDVMTFEMPEYDVELVAYAYSKEIDPRLPHSVQITKAGENVNVIADDIPDYGNDIKYWTLRAPNIDDFIFTHWSEPTTSQKSFVNRDQWGRALDRVEYEFYATTTNIANYLSVDVDEDADGIPDGTQLYWYGSLLYDSTSDEDNDGLSFRDELLAGTNPHFYDLSKQSATDISIGATMWYNPHSYPVLTMLSEPEGKYCTTTNRFVKPGTTIMLPITDGSKINYWYWYANGELVRDCLDSSATSLIWTMPDCDTVLMAKVEGDFDYDGDNLLHDTEAAAGTNPLFFDKFLGGTSEIALGDTIWYNPNGYPWCRIRSELDSEYVKAEEKIVRPGVIINLPITDWNGTRWMWKCNGEWLNTGYNEDFSAIHFTMPNYDVELVALLDEEADVDGDGWTYRKEMIARTNPLFFDKILWGVPEIALGDTIWYNPNGYPWCRIRSELDSEYVKAEEKIVRPDTIINLPITNGEGVRWMWKCNGEWLNTGYNEDFSAIHFTMPNYDVELIASLDEEADVDGDGWAYRKEMSAGTSPLFYDKSTLGCISMAIGEIVEVDLQPFEHLQGVIVNGSYCEMFTSKWAGNDLSSMTFGENSSVVMVDIDGDAVLDMVVVYKGGLKYFHNCGSNSDIQFNSVSVDVHSVLANILSTFVRPLVVSDGANCIYVSDGGGEIFRYDFLNRLWSSTGKYGVPGVLDGELIVLKADGTVWKGDQQLIFDTPALNGLSMTCADVNVDGRSDILIADVDGRIWYYMQQENGSFQLQYKVWAGTGSGFADGLTISAIDWDADGDVDLLAGRSDGKLMLLRNPGVGRPTNLRGNAGVDNVVLYWDVNAQSRIKGYRVYRGDDGSRYDLISDVIPLPTYRDIVGSLRDYWYRVTALSRFYITGNTVPTYAESKPSDPLHISTGGVRMWLTDTSAFTCSNVTVIVSMNNTMGLSSNGMSFQFTYDDTILEPVKIVKRGLTQGLTFVDSANGGTWNVSATDGNVEAGSGRFIELVFRVKDVHDVTSTIVSLVSATLKTTENQAVNITLPQSATIEISDSNPIVPAIVSAQLANAAVDTGVDLELPVTITTSEVLTNFVADVLYDEAMLRFDGWSGSIQESNLALRFHSLDQHSVITNFSTVVTLTNIVAVDIHDFVVEAPACSGTVLIKNVNPILPAVVTVSTEDKRVDTLDYVTIPFKISSSQSLASGIFKIEYDTDALEYAGADGSITINAIGDFELTFLAKDQHEITQTEVQLVEARVEDINGFTVYPTVPLVASVIIHDAHPLVPAVVAMTLSDVAASTVNEFEMVLSITSTEALTSLSMNIDYDTSLLELRSGTLNYEGDVPDSVTLRFYAKENHTVNATTVTITPTRATDHNGFTTEISLPEAVPGNVILADSNPWQPATVSVNISGVMVDTLTEFNVPVTITSNETLTNFVATFSCDSSAIEYRGTNPVIFDGEVPSSFNLQFYAKDQHDITYAEIKLTNISAVDNHGLVVNSIADATGTALIHDANPLIPAVVAMTLSDVAASTENEFEMVLSITSTEALTSLAMDIDYNTSLLELRSGTLNYDGDVPDSVTLRFYAKENHTANSTTVTIIPVSATDHNGFATEITLPESVTGNVILADSNPWQPATVSVNISGVKVDTLTEFNVPVTITSNETLTNFVATVVCESTALEYRGANSVVFNGEVPSSFNLPFYAKDQHDITSAEVKLTNISAVDNHGLVANPIADATGTVLIHDANPPVPADVAIRAGSVNVKTLNMFELPVTITSSKVLTSVAFNIDWNQDLLEYRGITGANFDSGSISVSNNVPSVITLIFYAKDQHTATSATVSLSNASAKCTDNLDANITLFDGTISIVDSNPPVPPQVALALSDANGKSGGEVTVPLAVTSVGELATLNATIEWDAERLAMTSPIVSDSGSAQITSDGSIDLVFSVKPIINLSTNTTVKLVSASGTGANGLPAQIVTEMPLSANIVITRAIDKYGPGDLDGDGRLTDADVEKLRHYLVYKAFPSIPWYKPWALTGEALIAADVNCDSVVDGYDLTLLLSLVEEAKKGGAQ